MEMHRRIVDIVGEGQWKDWSMNLIIMEGKEKIDAGFLLSRPKARDRVAWMKKSSKAWDIVYMFVYK